MHNKTNCFKANYFKDKVTNILLGYIFTASPEHALVQLLTVIFHKDLIIISKTAYTHRCTFTLACNRAYNYYYNYFLLMLRTVLKLYLQISLSPCLVQFFIVYNYQTEDM